MQVIIKASINTLKKSESLLSQLSNQELCNVSIGPYYSSIGSHVRHIFDFYNCIFNVKNGVVDLTSRERNTKVESCCLTASEYLNIIINRLNNFNIENSSVVVIDDLGIGKTRMNYTVEALFAQANSHTIHHYAIISYIMDQLGIKVEDCDFGYNPSTPKPNLHR
ncbi:hypothetical protein PK35_09370 [Tamlana nanhaiensis]|uniref:DinB-like domain-containing protein n=1 Tax=Neotamlana nanhaiensis TaxID=1382798 RepID=A0A0D7W271_9FLAO|nr:hypothetical protein [Tamlana nanhaiensis]KJD33149.1 hypothetical protein PK35_09370 [Tamlana nanhaiensis]